MAVATSAYVAAVYLAADAAQEGSHMLERASKLADWDGFAARKKTAKKKEEAAEG